MEVAQAGGLGLLAHQINIPSTGHDRRSVSLSSLAMSAPAWQGQPLGACHLTSLPCPEAAQPWHSSTAAHTSQHLCLYHLTVYT